MSALFKTLNLVKAFDFDVAKGDDFATFNALNPAHQAKLMALNDAEKEVAVKLAELRLGNQEDRKASRFALASEKTRAWKFNLRVQKLVLAHGWGTRFEVLIKCGWMAAAERALGLLRKV